MGSEVSYQDWLRFYGQIRTSYNNMDNPSLLYDGGTAIHQLFAEFSLIDDENQSLSARVGRQEFLSNVWQMANDDPLPVRSRWNAVSANYNLNNVSFDVYLAEGFEPTCDRNFTDKANGNKSGALFASWNTSLGRVRTYYTSNKVKARRPQPADIQVLGISASRPAMDGFGYMVDGIYQMGKDDSRDVSAYMGFANIHYGWQRNMHWQFGAVMHYASGSDADSKKQNTFNPLWGGDPLGYALDGAYGNTMQFGSYAQMGYRPGQFITAGFLSTWRANTDDALYSIGQYQMFGADSDERYAYTNLYLFFDNNITSNLLLKTQLYYAFDSKYTEEVLSQRGMKSRNIASLKFTGIYNF